MMYCCSVHVFFLHLVFLWWEEVIQESAGVNVCDKKNCFLDEEKLDVRIWFSCLFSCQ